MRRALSAGLLVLATLLELTVSIKGARAEPSAAIPKANTISIATSPASLLIEVNGTAARAPFSFSCDPATNRTITALSPQVNGSTRYTFLNWSDGGSQNHTISCAAPGNFKAYFSIEYALSLNTDPSGLTVEVDGLAYATPSVVWCLSGTIRGVNAPSPQGANASRFIFLNWNDGGGQLHTVPCDSPRSLVAFFRITLTIFIFSNIQQPFQVNVDGIPRVLPAEFTCDFGTDRVLSVTTPQTVSNSTWRFTGWSDFGPNPRTIQCDGPGNYSANFERVVGPGQNPPPSPPIVTFVILAIVVAIIVILGLVLWLTNRKGSPMASAAPVPLQVRTPASLATRCPNCGSPAAQDWTYCMLCGASLR